jgi:hypothetical protein
MLSHRLYYCHEVETFLKFGPCAFLLSRIASILRIFEQKLEKGSSMGYLSYSRDFFQLRVAESFGIQAFDPLTGRPSLLFKIGVVNRDLTCGKLCASTQ